MHNETPRMTETPIDLESLPQPARDAIQKRAWQWGISTEQAALRMLVEHSRDLQSRAQKPRQGVVARLCRSLFGSA